jgi:2-dehydro-3-deoxygluconokinase
MRAATVSDVILPSHDDEAMFFGDANPDATLQRYLSAGATTVVVKNGGGDIVYSDAGHAGSLTPAMVEKIVDTTAAGDSFNAGFLAEFGSSDIEGAIQAGCARAGKVIGGRGALVDV